MGASNGLERTVDTVGSLVEKWDLVVQLNYIKLFFNCLPISELSNVVEVGIGGGQVTLPILEIGCKFTVVESGESFSKLCIEKFKDYPTFSVITSKFENAEFEEYKEEFRYSYLQEITINNRGLD